MGLDIHDGYGQTETGQLTGMPAGEPVRPGSMGRALPGFGLEVVDEDGPARVRGRADARPGHRPDVLSRLPRASRRSRDPVWRTGDRVRRDDDGFLWFEGRLDDVILSAGYRIGPFEVESALVEHPAVAEAAAVAAPDAERGAVVKAVVVLRPGHTGGPALAAELQDHVKARHRSLQVSARGRVRRRAAEDGEREDPARGAARGSLRRRSAPVERPVAPRR